MALRVFITGASSGIGEALAWHYAGAGARLGILARREDALRALAARIGPERCAWYAGDVRDPRVLAHAAERFVDAEGAPDIVIANAGLSVGTLTEQAQDLAVFDRVFATNVMGMVNTFSPFIAPMRRTAHGDRRPALVGIASIAGYRGLPGAGAYCASKAAAISYLESLRVELRPSGIAVITICPGYIATEMTRNNPYRMPFLMPAEKAAGLIARAIDRREPRYVFPWQMALAAGVLKVLPVWLFDRLVAGAARKPRGSPER